MSELLPCPFCGPGPTVNLVMQNNPQGGWLYEVVCQGCSVTLPCDDDEAGAIAEWNRRASSTDAAQGTVSAPLDRQPQYVIEGIILRRLHEKRIEGYTIETAKEIAEAVAALSPAPVGYIRIWDEPEISPDFYQQKPTTDIPRTKIVPVYASPLSEGERQKLPQFVIRRNDDGSIDEVVGEVRFVHIEQMSNDSWFVAFDTPDGAQQRFWMGSKNRKSEVVFRHDETIPAALTAARDTEGKEATAEEISEVVGEAIWDGIPASVALLKRFDIRRKPEQVSSTQRGTE